MWYYDSQIIRTPKTMVISGITHPKGIFRDSTMLASLGIKPYTETRQDSRYYWEGSYSVDTSGDTVEGTYAGTVKNLADLRAVMLSKMNSNVKALLSEIDWYWQRAAKGNDAVPSAIATYATTIYSEKDTKETEIGNLNTIAKIKEYEARAYTETQKEKTLNGDGSFKEYHASNTYTLAREIDMTVHFTVHPNKIDAGLVSLTAD
jgi:hypothetical protein